MRLKRNLFSNSTNRESLILGSGFLGGATLGGILGRRYRLRKEQKDAEKTYDPEKHATEYDERSREAENSLKELRKERKKLISGKDKYYGDDYLSRLRDLDIEEEDLEGTVISSREKASDIRSNPEKYRKESGLKARQDLKNKLRHQPIDKNNINKYERRGMIIGGTLGAGLGIAGALKAGKLI